MKNNLKELIADLKRWEEIDMKNYEEEKRYKKIKAMTEEQLRYYILEKEDLLYWYEKDIRGEL